MMSVAHSVMRNLRRAPHTMIAEGSACLCSRHNIVTRQPDIDPIHTPIESRRVTCGGD